MIAAKAVAVEAVEPEPAVTEVEETPADVLSAAQLDALNAYKKQIEESLKAERDAEKEQTAKEIADLKNYIEEIKKSQMKDDERKRYEEQQRIEKEAQEKLALAEQNKLLAAELEKIRTNAYITETLAKYPFIEQKYKNRFTAMTREEFDRNFTEDFIQDQRELAEYRKRDKEYGNRNAFSGVNGKAVVTDPRVDEIVKFKGDFLKELGIK